MLYKNAREIGLPMWELLDVPEYWINRQIAYGEVYDQVAKAQKEKKNGH